jgi:hypothetical protein
MWRPGRHLGKKQERIAHPLPFAAISIDFCANSEQSHCIMDFSLYLGSVFFADIIAPVIRQFLTRHLL